MILTAIRMIHRIALSVGLLSAVWGCSSADNGSLVKDPAVPQSEAVAGTSAEADVPKGETFYVLFDTSKGPVIVAVHPGWAPLGAARIKELVEQQYYDECRFFRVLSGFMAQVGISGDPALNAKWRDARIEDDAVKVSNARGRVTFATGGPHTRTTQIFFNYGDNGMLDGQGFSPFGEVVVGMDVLESLYSAYGEGAPRGAGPDQGQIQMRGNPYLVAQFPNLDYIKTARLFDTLEAAQAESSESAATEPARESPAADGAAEPAAVDAPAKEEAGGDAPAAEANTP